MSRMCAHTYSDNQQSSCVLRCLRTPRRPAQLQMTPGDIWRELNKGREVVTVHSSAYATGCCARLYRLQDKLKLGQREETAERQGDNYSVVLNVQECF